MIIEIAQWIVLFFGVFIVFIGCIMLIYPEKARRILRKAGSTNFINYAEITIRLIPAIALVVCSEFSKFPAAFKVFGGIMLITSLVLYFVPRKIHHQFSVKSAAILTPLYVRLISPLAFLLGGLIIYNLNCI
jgi:protein-S-isoprenylcysteine O-methyltransferase Ste14